MSTNFPSAKTLGLYDLLPSLLVPGEPWVEWGIVEHRMSLAAPKLYGDLYEHYGHVTQHPRRYSVSSYLAGRLGFLASKGRAAFQYGEATGRWAYNHRVSYWSLNPATPKGQIYTWEQYAADNGLDGPWWQLIGRDKP
jgi:hypothetical protein